jgi:hypothetical protein
MGETMEGARPRPVLQLPGKPGNGVGSIVQLPRDLAGDTNIMEGAGLVVEQGGPWGVVV